MQYCSVDVNEIHHSNPVRSRKVVVYRRYTLPTTIFRLMYHYLRGSAGSVQPSFSPLFCSFSQSIKGLKYSTIAEASALSVPVMAFSASGQGLDAPISSIAFSLAPASLEP